MRLKLIADAGLVGLLNAGKSTSWPPPRGRLKIADASSPRCTRSWCGRVDEKEFVLADIPA